MTTSPIRDFDCPEVMFTPNNEAMLLAELRSVIPPGQQARVIDDSMGKSITSIRHKLNVAMHQAALICDLNPEHFTIFDDHPDVATRDIKTTYAIYKRCLFYMNDIEEYRLFLSFFIESYSAVSLSLLDVSGHLINDIYHFGLSSDQINFGTIIETYKQKRSCDDFYDFLMLHKPNKKGKTPHTNHAWIDPLAEIRHCTTHRPINDICDTVFFKRASIYAQVRQQKTEFMLNQNLFVSGSKDVKLCDFVKETFVGLQRFVGELYDRLGRAIHQTGGLPPY